MSAPRRDASVLVVAGFVLAQMLPATLIAPAIRPFFAAYHGGAEGPMHAFMSVNMAGALLAAPLCGALVDRIGRSRGLLAALAALDGLLFLAMSLPIPTPLLLVLRFVEGAAHVGAATLLLSAAATLSRAHGTGRAMGAAGASLLFAVSIGHALGAALLRLDPRAPFVASSLIAFGVAGLALLVPLPAPAPSESGAPRTLAAHLAVLARHRELVPVVASVFVGRFTVGCIVVTFALWARATHALSDSHIGLLFAALTGIFALTTYPAGRLCDRVPPAIVLVLGAATYALALALIPHVPASGLLSLFVIAGVASGLFFAAALHEVGARTEPGARGRVSAAVHAAGCLGMLVGPIVAGIVSARGAHARALVFEIAAGSLVVWVVAALPWALCRARAALGSGQRPAESRSASESGSPAARIARAAPSTS